jgi:hypothetical protein
MNADTKISSSAFTYADVLSELVALALVVAPGVLALAVWSGHSSRSVGSI